jgi:hypothetical protein
VAIGLALALLCSMGILRMFYPESYALFVRFVATANLREVSAAEPRVLNGDPPDFSVGTHWVGCLSGTESIAALPFIRSLVTDDRLVLANRGSRNDDRTCELIPIGCGQLGTNFLNAESWKPTSTAKGDMTG